MAAVAGAVADTVLAAMLDKARPRRAYVNNGGDIALWLTGAERFRTLVSGSDNAELARITLTTSDPARGIATSGRHGRSLSRPTHTPHTQKPTHPYTYLVCLL